MGWDNQRVWNYLSITMHYVGPLWHKSSLYFKTLIWIIGSWGLVYYMYWVLVDLVLLYALVEYDLNQGRLDTSLCPCQVHPQPRLACYLFFPSPCRLCARPRYTWYSSTCLLDMTSTKVGLVLLYVPIEYYLDQGRPDIPLRPYWVHPWPRLTSYLFFPSPCRVCPRTR